MFTFSPGQRLPPNLIFDVGYPPYFYERPWSDTTVTNHEMDASELSFVGSTYDLVIVQFEDDVVKSIDD